MLLEARVNDFIGMPWNGNKLFWQNFTPLKDDDTCMLVFSLAQKKYLEFFMKHHKEKGLKILYKSDPSHNKFHYNEKFNGNVLVIFENE